MLKKLYIRLVLTKRKKAFSETGQALVEFALCLPILMTILCGILDFGWLFMNEYEANHATYEAARYAAVYCSDDGISTAILESNMRAIKDENLPHKTEGTTVTFDWPASSGIAKVTVTNPVHLLTYVGMSVLGGTYQVRVNNAFYADFT